jgi:hypothetical protein
MSAIASWQRETFRRAGIDVEEKLRKSPGRVLPAFDVERTTVEHAEHHVTVPDKQLSLLKAQWEAAVAAASRLEEHERAMLGPNAPDRLRRCWASNHARDQGGLAHRHS